MIEVATVGAAFRAVARTLAAVGIETPHLDARLLIGRTLDIGPEAIIAYPDRPLDPAKKRTLEALVARRAGREPLSHILGLREFWGLDFCVTNATLDPRPDSETIVSAALDHIGGRERALRVLDFGTGTGCLLLSLLRELPAAMGIGVDASMEAAAVARSNATRLGLAERASFVVARWGEGMTGEFDLIVANPPYIRSQDFSALAPEVARFEPRLALDGGGDGLASYPPLAIDIARLLARGGAAVVEFGHDQAEAVGAMLRTAGLASSAAVSDLAGRPRCIVVTRRFT